MKMKIPGRADVESGVGGSRYYGFFGQRRLDATTLPNAVDCAVAGNLLSFHIERETAMAGGTTETIDIYVNGSPVGSSLVLSPGSQSGSITGPFAVTDGQSIGFRSTRSGTITSGGVYRWTVIWEGTNAQEAFICSRSAGGPNTTVVSYDGTYGQIANATTENLTYSIHALAKTVTRVIVNCSATPSPGTVVWALRINGVTQDGTGGTPDTRLSFTTTGVQSVTGLSIAIAPGDQVSWTATPSAAPVSSMRFSHAMAYTPAVDGQSEICGYTGAVLGSGTHYNLLGGQANHSSTETDVDFKILGSGLIKMSDFHARCIVSSPSGDQWILTLRKTAANTALVATITGTATTGQDTTNSAVLGSGDTTAIQIESVNGPNTSRLTFGMVQTFLSGSFTRQVLTGGTMQQTGVLTGGRM